MAVLITILALSVFVAARGLAVVGNEAVPDGEILAAAGAGPGPPDTGAVKDLYDAYGFLDASAEFSANGRTLFVSEGPRYRTGSLSVEGDGPHTSKEVRERLALGRGEFFSRRSFLEALSRLLEDLRDDGFLEARAFYTLNKDPAAGSVDVRLVFDAGTSYAVGQVGFLGVGAFTETELRSAMETREGARLSAPKLAVDISEITELYRRRGYPEAAAEPARFVLAKAYGAVDFSIAVEEGHRVVVQEILISGAKRTRPGVINRELAFAVGEPYDSAKIRKSRRRLYLLRYFERPPGINLADPANGVLEVTVEEIRTYIVSGALGYEPATEYAPANLLGYASASVHNLLGTGRDLDFRLSRPGKENLDLEGVYYEPWIAGVDMFARPRLEYKERSTYRKMDGELTFGTHPAEGLTVAAGGGFARVWEKDPSRTLKALFRVSYDTRDYFPNPRTGWELGGEVQARFKEYLEDGFRDVVPAAELDVWRYFPVTAGTVLAARAKTAGVFAARFTDDEYTYLGGPRDLRGFKNEQFPVSSYVLGTVEYRFIAGRRGRLFVFADGAYRRREGADGFELGWGAGFRAPTALGTYGVDFGVPAGESPLDGKVHVTITQEF